MYRRILILVAAAWPMLVQAQSPRIGDRSLDEAMIDRENWLREPFPQHEMTRIKAGLKPDAATQLRLMTPTIPDEETLRRDEIRLRTTILTMQGDWRVERMFLDGSEYEPIGNTRPMYSIEDTVMARTETCENWVRIVRIPANQIVSPTFTPAELRQLENGPRGERIYRIPVTPQTGELLEEAFRLNMLFIAVGKARVHWWDRYAETEDPHLSRNKPSQRISLPVHGTLEVSGNAMTIAVRGVGMRSFLPTTFQRPFEQLDDRMGVNRTVLETERNVKMMLVRDEDTKNLVAKMRRVPMAGYR